MKQALVAAALVLGACNHTPVAPTITAVDAPTSASPGDKITLTIHFSDPDDAVSAVRIAFPSTSQSTVTQLPNLVYTGENISVNVTFPPQTPLGPFEIDLSLLDQSALESVAAMQVVTIQ
jgi:hypothetical protein